MPAALTIARFGIKWADIITMSTNMRNYIIFEHHFRGLTGSVTTMARWPVIPQLGEPYSTIVITLAASYLFKPTLKKVAIGLMKLSKFFRK